MTMAYTTQIRVVWMSAMMLSLALVGSLTPGGNWMELQHVSRTELGKCSRKRELETKTFCARTR